MSLQDIIAELDNIIEQASSDDEIGKEAVVEALQDVVRDSEGIDDKNYVMKLIQDVRKNGLIKLSYEDGLACNSLWRKYGNSLHAK